MSEKGKFIEQLRELADFYESAPDNLPRPYLTTLVYVEKDDIPIIIRACRKLTKTSSNGYLSLSKSLNYGSVSFRIAQGEVCERKVVGQKWVPEFKQEGHFQDQVEWECKPVLKGIEEEEAEDKGANSI